MRYLTRPIERKRRSKFALAWIKVEGLKEENIPEPRRGGSVATAAIKGHSATSLNFGTPKLYVAEAARPFISPCAWQQGLGIDTKAATRA